MNTSLIPFAFGAVRLREACWIDDTPYFTRRAIGEWLEYPQPQQAIRNIIKRNPHLSDPRWSVVVKLTSTDGKQYEHQLFDPIGLQLVVFESRQPRALQYKIAVANLAWHYMNGTLGAELAPPLFREVLQTQKHTRARGAAQRALAEAQGWSLGQVRYRLKLLARGIPMRGCGRPAFPGPEATRPQIRHRAIYLRALKLRRQGRLLWEIADTLGLRVSTVGNWSLRAGLVRTTLGIIDGSAMSGVLGRLAA